MRHDVGVIIPVYNEASVVGDVINSAAKHFGNIICVDDGSADNSSEVIVNSEATLVRHPINLGAGAAQQTGFDFALQNKALKYFITIDADGQHDIRDAVKMLTYLKQNKLDCVIGSRFLGRVENISPTKLLLLRGAHVFSRFTSGINLSDPHNGLQVYSRKFAENLKLTLPGYSHKSEIIQRLKDGDFTFDEFPVTVRYTAYSTNLKSRGQSMLNAINISFELFIHRFSK